MLWYWDWVDRRDLYHEFAPVAAFAAGVDWVKEDYRPLPPAGLHYVGRTAPAAHGTLTVDPTTSSWEDGSPLLQPHTVTVGTDGTVRGAELLNAFVHGSGHADWRNPITFEVDYPQAGRFEVVIAEVSRFGGARLVITVDGQEALSQELLAPPRRPRGTPRPAEPPAAPIYGVDVPAGKHRIVVESQGQDWFRASYRLVGYLTVPNLRVLALGNRDGALVWVQNREHTWWNAARGLVNPVKAAAVTLKGFAPGTYEVEQWDTYSGKALSRQRNESPDGTVILVTPEGLTKDFAYRVTRTR
jgi:hypothetical protein